jgi:hypothetical protein
MLCSKSEKNKFNIMVFHKQQLWIMDASNPYCTSQATQHHKWTTQYQNCERITDFIQLRTAEFQQCNCYKTHVSEVETALKPIPLSQHRKINCNSVVQSSDKNLQNAKLDETSCYKPMHSGELAQHAIHLIFKTTYIVNQGVAFLADTCSKKHHNNLQHEQCRYQEPREELGDTAVVNNSIHQACGPDPLQLVLLELSHRIPDCNMVNGHESYTFSHRTPQKEIAVKVTPR